MKGIATAQISDNLSFPERTADSMVFVFLTGVVVANTVKSTLLVWQIPSKLFRLHLKFFLFTRTFRSA